MSRKTLEQRLNALKIAFIEKLPACVEGIESNCHHLQRHWNLTLFMRMHENVRFIHDNAAWFQLPELEQAANELDMRLLKICIGRAKTPNYTEHNQISQSIRSLNRIAVQTYHQYDALEQDCEECALL